MLIPISFPLWSSFWFSRILRDFQIGNRDRRQPKQWLLYLWSCHSFHISGVLFIRRVRSSFAFSFINLYFRITRHLLPEVPFTRKETPLKRLSPESQVQASIGLRKKNELAPGEKQEASHIPQTAGHKLSHVHIPLPLLCLLISSFLLHNLASVESCEVASSSHLQDLLICLQRVSSVHGFGSTKCTKMKVSPFYL